MGTESRTDMGTPKSPRAEPLQPDRPTQGNDRQESGDPDKGRQKKMNERAEEQEKNAIDNAREGYD